MGLVSMHAGESGQSGNVQDVIKALSKNSKYTVADIDRIYQASPVFTAAPSPPLQHALNQEYNGDFPMLDTNDEGVEQASKLAVDHRNLDFAREGTTRLTQPIERIESYFTTMDPTRLKTIFVVDTNFILSSLGTLEGLRTLAFRFHHQILIPRTVIQELDGLKTSSHEVIVTDEEGNRKPVSQLARSANDWIYGNLANLNSGLVGQKLRQTVDSSCIKDDAILDCCLYFKYKLNCFVILMSNDKNLCLKALTEEVLTVSYRKGMSPQLIASKAYEENISRFGTDSLQQNTYRDSHFTPQFHELMSTIYNEVHDKMVDAVDYAIRQEYDSELGLINYCKDDLLNLRKISLVIAQFWISVFGQLFENSKMRQSDWKELPDSILEVPRTAWELELFTNFWKEVLNILFTNRSDQELEQLKTVICRWDKIAAQFDH